MIFPRSRGNYPAKQGEGGDSTRCIRPLHRYAVPFPRKRGKIIQFRISYVAAEPSSAAASPLRSQERASASPIR